MKYSFLYRIAAELIKDAKDLKDHVVVFPGKRPQIFFKKALEDLGYSGFLPRMKTIEELTEEISGATCIQGLALTLEAYRFHTQLYPMEFSEFLKWFPALAKDWDEILKFAPEPLAVLDYMQEEERILQWAKSLGQDELGEVSQRFLDFWKKNGEYLPQLDRHLEQQGLASPGMVHQLALKNVGQYIAASKERFVFCGLNALTRLEEKLIRELLALDKAQCYFHSDSYYMDNSVQEAGAFLRRHRQWKEFNDFRQFQWVDQDFMQSKYIALYEVPGNVTQTKLLSSILQQIKPEELEDTAVVLLDENLLPSVISELSFVEHLNITMGYPIKNMAFSQGIRALLHLHKQLEIRSGSYYYKDLVNILTAIPAAVTDNEIIATFQKELVEKNRVYLSYKMLKELLGDLSYFSILEKCSSPMELLEKLLAFTTDLKTFELSDLQYENISHFEKQLRILSNQLADFDFVHSVDVLEILINQLVQTQTIDFVGEPLKGLQVMGLLETRLLTFKNVVLLSVNEGKLPGSGGNSYIPFNVRASHQMHTYLESDSIYAYHFYRLIQQAEKVYLLYNSLTSGINSGEKSRFITQLQMESPHKVHHFVVDTSATATETSEMSVSKTPALLERLERWKSRVAASHLNSYLYNPMDFYLKNILYSQNEEIEEELSSRNYGNLIHFSLEYLYEPLVEKYLTTKDLEGLLGQTEAALAHAMERLKHDPAYYAVGMNYIHKEMALSVLERIIKKDKQSVEEGSSLRILAVEKRFSGVPLEIPGHGSVELRGIIDRMDEFDGQVRLIDYKSSLNSQELSFGLKSFQEGLSYKHSKGLQLAFYLYALGQDAEYSGRAFSAGIWSFAKVGEGVQPLQMKDYTLEDLLEGIKGVIAEILDPDVPFTKTQKVIY